MSSKRTMIAIIVMMFAPITARPLRAASDDACSLLTQAQVSAVLGVSVDAGKRIIPNSALICGWSEHGGPAAISKRVMLTLSTPEKFTRGKAPYQGITKVPVSGIGDDAYFVTASGLGTTLNVLKGTSAFAVSVKGQFSADKVKEFEKVLARNVLSRL